MKQESKNLRTWACLDQTGQSIMPTRFNPNRPLLFTDDQVREIRRLYRHGLGMSPTQIAKKFGLGPNKYNLVHAVCKFKSYKDVR